MVWSKKATVLLTLTALVVMSIVIVPAVVRTKKDDRDSGFSAVTGDNQDSFSFPSDIPSIAPSDAPKRLGSDYPSRVPSEQPTRATYDIQSIPPSFSPVGVPTSVPADSVQQGDLGSDFPSMVPSSEPTVQIVSDYPSIVPSAWGTSKPTVNTKREVAPSDFPSRVPSTEPSKIPSLAPSKSAAPSDEPSMVPSTLPSDEPSMVPSTAPSMSAPPSSMPSTVPSAMPSMSAPPSSEPSASMRPSSVPSAVPSASSFPTTSDFPSLVPSSVPTEFVFRKGGTIVAVALREFVIIATDANKEENGAQVFGEDVTRLHEITDTTTLASFGCKPGVDQLITSLEIRQQIQERFGGLALTTFDVVNMVSGLIFNRRFNSCVENNVLAAIDVNANGAVFVYDEFGGFRRVAYAVVGPESVSDFVERFLLNSRTDDLDESNIAGILHEAFIGATERNLETGVQLDIRIIGSSGAVKRITQDLPL